MKPVLLQINICVVNKSTGRITEQIGQAAMDCGYESYIAYGDRTYPSKSQLIKVGSGPERIIHRVLGRIFDLQGRGSKYATRRLVRKIESIHPAVVHLHNIHCSYLNYRILFDYLAGLDIPVVWTLHDCWSMTGSCAHFESVSCDKWKTLCGDCPLSRKFSLDNSRSNYLLKKKVFTSLPRLYLAPVSKWLQSVVKASYLSALPSQVMYNGIDTGLFSPSVEAKALRASLGIGDKEKVILGVATDWSLGKGLAEFGHLGKEQEYRIVLVGVEKSISENLPASIIAVRRTFNQKDLAAYYSMADVFVNPTYNDSFPTVNLEALSCGCPVVTYDTGGCTEAIDEKTGISVPKGDFDALKLAIKRICSLPEEQAQNIRSDCRARALRMFDKSESFRRYVELYDKLREKYGA